MDGSSVGSRKPSVVTTSASDPGEEEASVVPVAAPSSVAEASTEYAVVEESSSVAKAPVSSSVAEVSLDDSSLRQ